MQVPRRLPGALARRYAGVFLILSACTIIEDSDLRSPSDFAKLQLQSIQIVQTINDRNKLTTGGNNLITRKAEIKTLADSVVTGLPGVARVVWYAVPALGDYKLKLRSGTTGSVKVYVYYTDAGEPYTMGVVNGDDEVVELYRFRYATGGALIRMNTFIVLQSGDTLATRDSIVYSTGRISEVIRGDASVSTLQYQGTGANQRISTINWYTGQTLNGQGQGSCPNNTEGNSCASFYVNGGPGSNPTVDISAHSLYARLEAIELADNRIFGSGDCSGCSRPLDTYYFHPTMLLASELQHGNDLFIFYALDWWEKGTGEIPNQALSGNEAVSLQFSYTR